MSTSRSCSGTPRAVLVIGPGRSGTSTLACALNVLGVDLGRKLKPPTPKNPRGFFEEVHLLRMIRKVRRTLGLRPDSVRLIADHEWHQPDVISLRERMIQLIRREFGNSPFWGFKYGGNGRLLPFWLDLFQTAGIEPTFALAYRNPLSIARSRARLDRLRGTREMNDLEWAVHVVPAMRRLAAYPLVVVDYDRLIDNPEGQLRRLARKLALPFDPNRCDRMAEFRRCFLNARLRHTRFGREDLLADESLSPTVREGALELDAIAADMERHDSPRSLQCWLDLDQQLQMLAPCLRLTDRLNEELRRARWWDVARPLRAALNAIPLPSLGYRPDSRARPVHQPG